MFKLADPFEWKIIKMAAPNGETPSANSPEGSPAGSSNETPSISDAPAGNSLIKHLTKINQLWMKNFYLLNLIRENL